MLRFIGSRCLPALKLNLLQQLKGQMLFILAYKMVVFRQGQVKVAQIEIDKT